MLWHCLKSNSNFQGNGARRSGVLRIFTSWGSSKVNVDQEEPLQKCVRWGGEEMFLRGQRRPAAFMRPILAISLSILNIFFTPNYWTQFRLQFLSFLFLSLFPSFLLLSFFFLTRLFHLRQHVRLFAGQTSSVPLNYLLSPPLPTSPHAGRALAAEPLRRPHLVKSAKQDRKRELTQVTARYCACN